MRLTLHAGFGGDVTAFRVPRAEAALPVCSGTFAAVSGPPEAQLYGTPPGAVPALCVSASTAGLEVHFRTRAARPIAFEYPATVSCVTLRPATADDVLVHVDVTVDDRRVPVTCDIDRSFLYALSIERHALGKPYVRPVPGAREWRGTIEIPWRVLELRGHEPQLHVAFSAPNVAQPIVVPVDVSIEDRSGALALAYAPLVHVETPAPSPKKPGPRLHQVEADVMFVPDEHTLVDAAFAQNDAAASVQRASGQILHDAPLALPSAAAGPSGPENIITRTQPLLSFLRPSNALGDQDLRVFVDSLPFALDKVPSLASGYTLGYASPILGGGAFYGLQRSGLYEQAYALTVSIPTPSPRVTPSPTPAPSPTPSPTTKLAVAPPPLATPGPIEESKTSHDPLATIALLDSFVGNGTASDSVAGIAFGTNFYRNTCASDASYCAVTFHLFGSEQLDAHPLASVGSASIVPPDASYTRVAGESASYTKIVSAIGTTPSFFQIGETAAFQQADRFYAPASGTITAFAPLGGSLGHVVFSYGTGLREHVYSVDVLGVRLTSPYGDVFTNFAEQLVVPFDLASLRGWTFNAGVQSESLSDRVAALQQGLATSYFSAVFPNTASYDAPVTPALIRPQSQQNATVTSPSFGKVLTAQAIGGFQNGSVTICAPAAKSVVCSTAHDHAATWALFLSRASIGFGLANTASAAIPGDLAAGTTARYFGSYVNSPGSVTSYVSFSKCINLSAAYTNAAFPAGVPLPQQGATVAAKAYVPLRSLGVEGGYFRTTDTSNPTLNQSGYYALVRFLTVFHQPAPAPGCAR